MFFRILRAFIMPAFFVLGLSAGLGFSGRIPQWAAFTLFGTAMLILATYLVLVEDKLPREYRR